MDKKTYWNHDGRYETLGKRLQVLIPLEGAVQNTKQNPALEKFRKASNCYYDLYNNGLCNRAREFYSVFKIPSSQFKQAWRGYGRYDQRLYAAMEEVMNDIIYAAAEEQNLLEGDVW
jgi:hypothetical protein